MRSEGACQCACCIEECSCPCSCDLSEGLFNYTRTYCQGVKPDSFPDKTKYFTGEQHQQFANATAIFIPSTKELSVGKARATETTWIIESENQTELSNQEVELVV